MTTKTRKPATKPSTKTSGTAHRAGTAHTQARIDASPAVNPRAQQVASIDVNPNVEMAAARKHAARSAQSAKAVKPSGQAKTSGRAKAKTPATTKQPKPRKVSALDAAAQVLAKSTTPMTSKGLITEMEAKRLWTSPGGRTPEATLNAAIHREITTKGKASRFKKVDRGLFIAVG